MGEAASAVAALASEGVQSLFTDSALTARNVRAIAISGKLKLGRGKNGTAEQESRISSLANALKPVISSSLQK